MAQRHSLEDLFAAVAGLARTLPHARATWGGAMYAMFAIHHRNHNKWAATTDRLALLRGVATTPGMSWGMVGPLRTLLDWVPLDAEDAQGTPFAVFAVRVWPRSHTHVVASWPHARATTRATAAVRAALRRKLRDGDLRMQLEQPPWGGRVVAIGARVGGTSTPSGASSGA